MWCKLIVGVDAKEKLAFAMRDSGVVGSRLPPIFLFNVTDGEEAILHEASDECLCAVARAVIDNEPTKIIALLPLQALEEVGQPVCAIVGRSEYADIVHFSYDTVMKGALAVWLSNTTYYRRGRILRLAMAVQWKASIRNPCGVDGMGFPLFFWRERTIVSI